MPRPDEEGGSLSMTGDDLTFYSIIYSGWIMCGILLFFWWYRNRDEFGDLSEEERASAP